MTGWHVALVTQQQARPGPDEFPKENFDGPARKFVFRPWQLVCSLLGNRPEQGRNSLAKEPCPSFGERERLSEEVGCHPAQKPVHGSPKQDRVCARCWSFASGFCRQDVSSGMRQKTVRRRSKVLSRHVEVSSEAPCDRASPSGCSPRASAESAQRGGGEARYESRAWHIQDYE